MRRSAPLREPEEYANTSFPGLLETLIHSDRHNSAESKTAVSGTRRQPAKLLPEAKARHVDEAATLSYEQALRRHSRRTPTDEPDLPTLPNEKLSASGLPEKTVSKPASQAADHTKPIAQASQPRRKIERAATSPSQRPASQTQGQSLNSSQTQSRLQSRARAETRKTPPRAANPRTKPQTSLKPGLRASGERTSRRAKPPSRPQQAGSAPQPSQRPTPSSLSDKALELRRSLREHLQFENPSTESNGPRRKALADAQPDPLVPRAITRQGQAALEPMPAPETAQRRTILSLRLSEEESAQLKLRAAESGISVSAYMRSCVLDAEHLRAQVKQALAEMRLSIHRSEPVSTMQIATQPGTAARGTWFGVITRTAALFLAPLLSMRHRS